MIAEADAVRAWTDGELATLRDNALIDIAVARRDGGLRPGIPIGHVRVEGEELVRSLTGPDASWYRAAMRSRRARISVGGHRIDVVVAPYPGPAAAVDRAFRRRYGTNADVRAITTGAARMTTLLIQPRR